ncbi:hypothetical protein C7444_105105 [Sphaerotilus hippei]|uniref:Uncharacterized protein n=1 Tax=Sphaerotilus hippei TaxID=744406 RepID=A0A318H9P6_9BURK|nr:hypothetical protein [Sphaerotilus hippei]PXW97007.1 hypothetical protein C7444_105105 [Sphaerotilus hippei]
MTRCVVRPASRPRRALLLAGLCSALMPVRAQELVSRSFPAHALRGVITFSSPPDVVLNGVAARLAPGARIRDARNLLVLTGALDGQTAVVHYTIDLLGQLRDLWMLRSDEIARFWPGSAAEAALYQFDPVAQTWTRLSS